MPVDSEELHSATKRLLNEISQRQRACYYARNFVTARDRAALSRSNANGGQPVTTGRQLTFLRGKTGLPVYLRSLSRLVTSV